LPSLAQFRSKTGGARGADEPAQDGQRVGEERPARLQLVVAADLVVVGERWEDRRVGEGFFELQRQELHGLAHEIAIGGVGMIGGRGIERAAKTMGEKIAGQQQKKRVRQGFFHLVQNRAQQQPAAVGPVSAEAPRRRALENGPPIRRRRCSQSIDQARVGHRIEMQIRDHQESPGRGGLCCNWRFPCRNRESDGKSRA